MRRGIEHKRPMHAFVAVAMICGLVIAHQFAATRCASTSAMVVAGASSQVDLPSLDDASPRPADARLGRRAGTGAATSAVVALDPGRRTAASHGATSAASRDRRRPRPWSGQRPPA